MFIERAKTIFANLGPPTRSQKYRPSHGEIPERTRAPEVPQSRPSAKPNVVMNTKG
jgi:hypothetical protein